MNTDTTFGVAGVVPGDILFLVSQDSESDEACYSSSGNRGFRSLDEAKSYATKLMAQPRPNETGYREFVSIQKWTAPELCPGFPICPEDFETVIRWKRTTKRDWKVCDPPKTLSLDEEVKQMCREAEQELEYRFRRLTDGWRIIGERNVVMLDKATKKQVLAFVRAEIQRRQNAEDKAVEQIDVEVETTMKKTTDGTCQMPTQYTERGIIKNGRCGKPAKEREVVTTIVDCKAMPEKQWLCDECYEGTPGCMGMKELSEITSGSWLVRS